MEQSARCGEILEEILNDVLKKLLKAILTEILMAILTFQMMLMGCLRARAIALILFP